MDPPFHGKQCKLANPHSNAVVDLNGDCLAGKKEFILLNSTCLTYSEDVFLVCDDGRGGTYFQIWVNNKADGFSLAQEHALPAGTQQVSFADMGESHLNPS
jgi:integrin alpha FG-GAP repeat containing protein 1